MAAFTHWALLGGSFDPVHIGHLRIAIGLLEAGFQQVQLMPNYQSPHKGQTKASANQRYAMLELALNGQPHIQVNQLELKHNAPSYTFNSLNTWRADAHSASYLTWVIGIDAWLDLPNWYRCDDLLNLANLLIINRPHKNLALSDWHKQKLQQHQCDLPQLLKTKYNKIAFLDLPELDVSSSQIRAKCQQGQCIDYLVPDSVLNFIQQQGLYKT